MCVCVCVEKVCTWEFVQSRKWNTEKKIRYIKLNRLTARGSIAAHTFLTRVCAARSTHRRRRCIPALRRAHSTHWRYRASRAANSHRSVSVQRGRAVESLLGPRYPRDTYIQHTHAHRQQSSVGQPILCYWFIVTGIRSVTIFFKVSELQIRQNINILFLGKFDSIEIYFRFVFLFVAVVGVVVRSLFSLGKFIIHPLWLNWWLADSCYTDINLCFNEIGLDVVVYWIYIFIQ